MSDTSSEQAHWVHVWHGRDPDQVTWFEAVPTTSLELTLRHADRHEPVVDVGGGASRLVDELLTRGFTDVIVVDLAENALAGSRARLGDAADRVTWVVADARTLDLGRRVSLWHDRAVFHFLVDVADRSAYVDRLRAHLVTGGHLVVATFAADGPTTCSGRPVRRYDAEELAAEFGDGFDAVEARRQEHVTPTGAIQPFQYLVLRRTA